MYVKTNTEVKQQGVGNWLTVIGDIVGGIFGLNKPAQNDTADQAILLMLQQQQQQEALRQQQAQQTKWIAIAGIGAALALGAFYLSKKK